MVTEHAVAEPTTPNTPLDIAQHRRSQFGGMVETLADHFDFQLAVAAAVDDAEAHRRVLGTMRRLERCVRKTERVVVALRRLAMAPAQHDSRKAGDA